MVRERDLAGPRIAAAADQRDARSPCDAARGTAARPSAAGTKRPASDAIAATRERLVLGQRRQQRRAAAARASTCRCRAVRSSAAECAAGRGDLERALRVRLAAHVGEIGTPSRCGRRQRRSAAAAARAPARCAHTASSDARRIDASRRAPAPPRPALAAGSTNARPSRRARQRHRQRAADRRAARRSAPARRRIRSAASALRGNLARGGEDAERDRQVEAARLLRQVGGREVDGDLARRELELRVLQRGAHAVARLAHLGVGQADEVNAGSPPARCTSTVTRGASTPASARLWTTATRHAPSFERVGAPRALGRCGRARRRVTRRRRRNARLELRDARFQRARASRASSRSTCACTSNSARGTRSRRAKPACQHRLHVLLDVLGRDLPRSPCRSARRVRRSVLLLKFSMAGCLPESSGDRDRV